MTARRSQGRLGRGGSPDSSRRLLVTHVQWFIRIRWLVAGAVVGGTLINLRWLGWFGYGGQMLAVGGAIAA